MRKAVYKYLIYVIYFLGIGMTASGIVLMPFNPIRYSIILFIGLGLFLTSSIVNEIVIDNHKMSMKESLRLVFLSLTLALGIGMISGGIAHFKESPIYVAFLIPLGLIISFISFFLKNHYDVFKKNGIKLSISIVSIAIVLFIGLYTSANSAKMNMPVGGDIFKGHGKM